MEGRDDQHVEDLDCGESIRAPTQRYKLIHATVLSRYGRTILRDSDSARLMTMTIRFHWRQLRKIFLRSRDKRDNKKKKGKKRREENFREITIRFPVCRSLDMTDRKYFHFCLTLYDSHPTDLRAFTKFVGVTQHHLLSSSFTEILFYRNFQKIYIRAFTDSMFHY